MSHRLALGAILFVTTSCITGGTPPPGGSAAPSSATGATGAQCGQHKILTRSDLDGCKSKCRDEERDQLKSCSGPACQPGAAGALCSSKCDDQQKAAQASGCYKG